jgi:acetolactate synthase-1/2/3 large subunit/sulfoacetaldehyde acetyltransferase
MPESIGAKLAKPDAPVLAIAGDGGFLFNSQELETAVRERIGTVTLVMNNNIWGSEKALQSNLFGRTIGSELTNPRFDKLAELYGGRGFYVDDINQLGDVLKEAFATTDRPSVIEIPVDPDDLSNLARR